MIKLKDIINEIGEGSNSYPIGNKNEALSRAKRIYGSMLRDGEDADSESINIDFVSANNVKYYASYDCIPHKSKDGTGAVASVEIGFAAKDLGQYGNIRKGLTEFLNKFGKKFLIRTVDAKLVDGGKTIELSSVRNPKFIKSKHNVVKIPSTPFVSKPSVFIGDIGSALTMGDFNFELEATYKQSPALPKDIECWKSTDEPGLYFIQAYKALRAFVDPSDASSPLVKNVIKYLVDNTSLDYKDQVITNKGDAIKVVSTVVSFAKELGTIIPIDAVKFSPAKRPGEEDVPSQESGRGRLYLAFVKKAYPDAQVNSIGSGAVVVLLNKPTINPIVAK